MIIEIHDYDPAWPQRFRELAEPIRDALGSAALRIDHIGSTSVLGLAAKPIIDIQISVAALEPMEPYSLGLTALGYVWHADNPERTKRYFREPPGQGRIHIHVRKLGSWGQQYALLFRDFLRASPETREYYAAAKRELAQREWEDIGAFADGKEPIFWEIIRRANTWSQETAWEPGPPDYGALAEAQNAG